VRITKSGPWLMTNGRAIDVAFGQRVHLVLCGGLDEAV
jgi:hypothetical protein